MGTEEEREEVLRRKVLRRKVLSDEYWVLREEVMGKEASTG
jgi:hypothetical protein